MIGKIDLEYFAHGARLGCLNTSEQTALVDEVAAAQKEWLRLAGVRDEGKAERDKFREALVACRESLRLIESEMLPEGQRFAPWSHPAVSMRIANAALAGEQKADGSDHGG